MTSTTVAPPRNALDPLEVLMTNADEAKRIRSLNPDGGPRVIVAGSPLSAEDIRITELRVAGSVAEPLTRLPAEVSRMSNLRLLCLGPHVTPEFMSSLENGAIPPSVRSLGVLSGGNAVRWPASVRLPDVIDLRSDGALSFDRTSFPHLRAVVVKPDRGNKNLIEIAQYEALEELQLLTVPDAGVFEMFAHQPLRRAGLLGGKLTSLEGIGSWPHLEWLRLHTLNTLESISALKSLRKLQVLEIRYCKRITDIETLLELPSLKRLEVVACGKIGISRIEGALKLEDAYISAST